MGARNLKLGMDSLYTHHVSARNNLSRMTLKSVSILEGQNQAATPAEKRKDRLQLGDTLTPMTPS